MGDTVDGELLSRSIGLHVKNTKTKRYQPLSVVAKLTFKKIASACCFVLMKF
jgi:hypothetical protein